MTSETRKDLTDITFTIPLRVDSDERIENLEIVIDFLKSHFFSNIIVLEAGMAEKYITADDVIKIFVKDDDPVFHATKYRNEMIRRTTTNFVALWDSDVLAPVDQIIQAYELLRKNLTDVVFPYDGKFYDTHALFKSMYKENQDIAIFEYNVDKFKLMHGLHSVGGAVFMNREKYLLAGMENEKIYGWGPDDYERVKRCEILGYKISWIDGPLFHLHHPRGKSGWFYSDEINIRSKQEFFKVCRMNRQELSDYVHGEEWNEKN
ncbi:MAG: glycosyltransferase family 2 protein [Bacteroidales bacterium]|nr:glycosyltransferase family 2 protein [Bacteroidales bacterium]